jgi:hypothetical protein
VAAIDWNVTVTSDENAWWTAPVTSTVEMHNYSNAAAQVWLGGVRDGMGLSASHNPLGPADIDACTGGTCTLPYGGPYAAVQRSIPGEEWYPALALPVVSVLLSSSSSSSSNSSGNNHGSYGLSLIQSPKTVAVGASISTTLIGASPPPSPSPSPSPPGVETTSLVACNGTDPHQAWVVDGEYVRYQGKGSGKCLSLVKTAPFPAIVFSCEEVAGADQANLHRHPSQQHQGQPELYGGPLRNDELWEHLSSGQLVMRGFNPDKGKKSDWCLGYDPLALGQNIRLEPCSSTDVNQVWNVTDANGTVLGFEHYVCTRGCYWSPRLLA